MSCAVCVCLEEAERQRARAELAAVLVTGVLFLFFENVLHLKLQFLIPCIALWAAYIVRRLYRDRTLAARWGLRLDNLKSAAPPLFGCFAAGAAALGAWHLVAGGATIPPGAWLLFVLYPVWALIQQFVLQALVASNLERLDLPRAAVIPITAALFGIAHLPDWPLAALCAAGGLVWTPIYLRCRHLPLLALTHAWLGALAFYWVLQRDPWGEMFMKH